MRSICASTVSRYAKLGTWVVSLLVLAACADSAIPTEGIARDEQRQSHGVSLTERVCIAYIPQFSVQQSPPAGVSASQRRLPRGSATSATESICGGASQASPPRLVLVTVTENLPQFSWINHAISIVPVSAEPHIFPERVTVNGTSIAPSGDTVSQTPPKPEGFTDEEWAELGEYTKRMWSDIMKALCEDSALPFAACGQLRSGALKTAIRNTQNALNLYPHGVPFRNAANQLVADDPATFGRRWAYATAELMRQIRLNSWFEDVSERNLITAVAGLAIASMQDRLVWPEQATWYTSSLTEAAKRAVSMNKFDVQAPDRLAEAMFYQGNLFPACAPTFHSAEYSQRSCQPSGGGGGGGGGGAGQLRAPVFP